MAWPATNCCRSPWWMPTATWSQPAGGRMQTCLPPPAAAGEATLVRGMGRPAGGWRLEAGCCASHHLDWKQCWPRGWLRTPKATAPLTLGRLCLQASPPSSASACTRHPRCSRWPHLRSVRAASSCADAHQQSRRPFDRPSSLLCRPAAAAAHAVDFLVHWQSRLLPSASSKLLFELHLQPDGTVSVVAFLPGR